MQINIRCHRALALREPGAPPRVIPLTEMAGIALGRSAEASASAVYIAMTFTLLLAYAARAGDVVEGAVSQVAPLPHGAGHAAFTAAIGGTLLVGGTPAAVAVNKVLTTAMLALFAAIVSGGAVAAGGGLGAALGAHADWSPATLAATLPIMFLALVYHDLIPVVTCLLDFDRRRVVVALLAGSAPPLAMFLCWEAITLGLVPFDAGLAAAGVDPLDALIASAGPLGGGAIAAFSLAALSTSAIGTSLSVTAFVRGALARVWPSSEQESGAPAAEGARPEIDAASIALSLVPPAILGATCAGLFRGATHVAGAYGDVALFGVLPPVLAWALRRQDESTLAFRQRRGAAPTPRLLAGGAPALAALCLTGGAIELVQLSRDVPLDSAAASMQPVYEVTAAGGGALVTTVSNSVTSWAATLQPTILQVGSP